MICVEPDGFYCKECNDFHPTLYWHELYDDYMKTKEESIELYKYVAERFDKPITDDEALELYYENMSIMKLEYFEEAGECIVCKNKTHYKSTKINKFVCSNKCKYSAE